MKIGMICRADLTGLGNQSQDWVKHLPIDKVLVAWGNIPYDPSIYQNAVVAENGIPSVDELKEFLKDLDLLLTIETPYNWSVFRIAREMGVKTILAPNYEFFPETLPDKPDLFLCYNPLTMDYIPEPKVYLPQPIDRDVFKFTKRTQANTFLFNNGNGGVFSRNSLHEFLQAIPLVKSNVKFIINSQVRCDGVPDSRVQINLGDQPLQKIWEEGDVFVHPRKFGANSLPMNEAMSLGMPVLGIDRKPENEILPKDLLVEADDEIPIRLRPDLIEIKSKIVSPAKLAQKIDELAGQDISEYSEAVNKQADEWSWKNQRDNWIKTFENLCSQSEKKKSKKS